MTPTCAGECEPAALVHILKLLSGEPFVHACRFVLLVLLRVPVALLVKVGSPCVGVILSIKHAGLLD